MKKILKIYLIMFFISLIFIWISEGIKKAKNKENNNILQNEAKNIKENKKEEDKKISIEDFWKNIEKYKCIEIMMNENWSFSIFDGKKDKVFFKKFYWIEFKKEKLKEAEKFFNDTLIICNSDDKKNIVLKTDNSDFSVVYVFWRNMNLEMIDKWFAIKK